MELSKVIVIIVNVFIFIVFSISLNYIISAILHKLFRKIIADIVFQVIFGIFLTYILLDQYLIELIYGYLSIEASIKEVLVRETIYTTIIIWWSLVVLKATDIFVWQRYLRGGRANPVPKILKRTYNVLFLLVVSLLLLEFVFNVDVTKLVVASGFIAFIAGYGAKSTVSDILGGITLSLEDNITINDWVKVDGVTGMVVAMDWRSICLKDFDKNLRVIPNSRFSSTSFTNISRPDTLTRIEIKLRLPADIHPDKLKKLIIETANGMSGLDKSKNKNIGVFYIGHEENHNIYAVSLYTDSSYSFGIRDEFMSVLHYKFNRENKSFEAPKLISIDPRKQVKKTTDVKLLKQQISSIHGKEIFNGKECEKIINESNMLMYGSQEIIVDQGIISSHLYYLLSGSVSVEKILKGKVIDITKLEAETAIGEISFLLGGKTIAQVRASTTCSILKVPHKTIKNIINKRPDLLELLANLVEYRMKHTKSVIEKQQYTKIVKNKNKNKSIFRMIKDMFTF